MTDELTELNLSELKALCKEQGLKGYSNLNKEKLVNLLLAENATPDPDAGPAPESTSKAKKGSSNTRPAAPDLTVDLKFADDDEKNAWLTEAYQHTLLREPHTQELAHYREQLAVGRASFRILEVLAESSEGQNKSLELGEVKTNRGGVAEELPKVADEEE